MSNFSIIPVLLFAGIIIFTLISVYIFVRKRSYALFLAFIFLGILIGFISKRSINLEQSRTGHYTPAGNVVMIMYPLFGMFIGAVVQNIYILAKESIKNKRH
jgi:hypothetical protein